MAARDYEKETCVHKSYKELLAKNPVALAKFNRLKESQKITGEEHKKIREAGHVDRYTYGRADKTAYNI